MQSFYRTSLQAEDGNLNAYTLLSAAQLRRQVRSLVAGSGNSSVVMDATYLKREQVGVIRRGQFGEGDGLSSRVKCGNGKAIGSFLCTPRFWGLELAEPFPHSRPLRLPSLHLEPVSSSKIAILC